MFRYLDRKQKAIYNRTAIGFGRGAQASSPGEMPGINRRPGVLRVRCPGELETSEHRNRKPTPFRRLFPVVCSFFAFYDHNPAL